MALLRHSGWHRESRPFWAAVGPRTARVAIGEPTSPNPFSWLSTAPRESPDTLSLTQTLLSTQSAHQPPFVPDRRGCLPLISKPPCLCAFCQVLSSLPSKLHFCLGQLKWYPSYSSNGTPSYGRSICVLQTFLHSRL